MKSPFHRLFESFETLSKEEADGSDGLEGIKTPYTQTSEDMVGTAVNDLSDQLKDFCAGINSVYNQLEPSMVVSSSGNLSERRQLSKSFSDTLAGNGLLTDDSLIRNKLSDILAFLYGHINGGKYLILSDFSKAKLMAASLYQAAKKQRNFPQISSSVDDIIQKVILAVLYKAPKQVGNQNATPTANQQLPSKV